MTRTVNNDGFIQNFNYFRDFGNLYVGYRYVHGDLKKCFEDLESDEA